MGDDGVATMMTVDYGVRSSGCLSSRKGVFLSGTGSFGNPRIRSPMVLMRIWCDPPAMVAVRANM